MECPESDTCLGAPVVAAEPFRVSSGCTERLVPPHAVRDMSLITAISNSDQQFVSDARWTVSPCKAQHSFPPAAAEGLQSLHCWPVLVEIGRGHFRQHMYLVYTLQHQFNSAFRPLSSHTLVQDIPGKPCKITQKRSSHLETSRDPDTGDRLNSAARDNRSDSRASRVMSMVTVISNRGQQQ